MILANDAKVRTDPLVFSQTGPCLSDHVHRFYGAVSDRTMRPEVTFADLRAATGNTGNVEENKSLYWNPVIYKVMDNIPNLILGGLSVCKGVFSECRDILLTALASRC